MKKVEKLERSLLDELLHDDDGLRESYLKDFPKWQRKRKASEVDWFTVGDRAHMFLDMFEKFVLSDLTVLQNKRMYGMGKMVHDGLFHMYQESMNKCVKALPKGKKSAIWYKPPKKKRKNKKKKK